MHADRADHADRANTEESAEENNARRFVWANGLQNLGDQLVSAKTVLPWLFAAAGVPAAFTALLVPFRESGAMLPQAALTPWVTGHPRRAGLWIAGAAGQAACAAGIAIAALALRGWALGGIVVVLLAGLAICRALCSITGKDVQGRTISKGRRGRVTGRATQLGGAATLAAGLALAAVGHVEIAGLALMLGIGAGAWAVSALVFRGIGEPEGASDTRPARGWWADTWGLYTGDAAFRSFVNVRTLLLVSALSTSFIVALSQSQGQHLLAGLAGFVLAAGLANLVGGRVSGWLSDASSRETMTYGALAASVVVLLLIASAAWAPAAVNAWAMPAGFFLVNLAHTAIRVARKTYVVDMAGGDKRTRYVGAANTMMGVILLGVGAVSAGIALLGSSAALAFLAALGLLGAWRAHRLPEVSARAGTGTR